MNAIQAFFHKLGPDIRQRTFEHICLTLEALVIAIFVAVPLGVLCSGSQRKHLVGLIMGAAGIIQTVPGLALVAFIAILFTLIGLPLIGEPPALFALVLYALLPILRNTYTGLRNVDDSVVEVARGMGMTRAQILLRVELPLALPVIMAGIRIATVWTIGIATLCTFIGAGGLGVLIMRGLQSVQVDYLLAGTIPAAVLAVAFDALLARAEAFLTPDGPWRRIPLGRRFKLLAAVSLGLVVLLGVVRAITWIDLETSRGGRETPIRAAFGAEFFTRPDGYPAVADFYGFAFPQEPQQMDEGLMYKSAADGAVDVINGFATDGRIKAFGLVVLEDDRHFFPPYYAAPLIRRDTLEAHPELESVLDLLAGKIDDDTMRSLNYAADEEGRKAREIAREFLVKEGLIAEDAAPPSDPVATITIGGKPFTEQEILGEIMATLIESRTELRVDRRLNLGGTMLCFDAIRSGDIDLYPEYTGTGLVSILGETASPDPDATYAEVQRRFSDQWDLVWLEPLGFNNTYTLSMRRTHAKELGIETISDLARVLGGGETPDEGGAP